ncbi:quinone oxidoreductase : Alcohol dehydrogenase zinc-binding domain protein OS=Anaeromyxobacter sp. (strain Fw109-5) GN=Anae109_2985 PE=4 SV=1: ADH_N: ADH_zinc_N [Gemmata massiliana]|uniref:Enoyl reductase (ER) domain-containing protein n=1 Tax=Gemmata massiliana TaxID=1210884 RepID=A0A6P2D115_9BACT|nr:quinone oxidoreductase [Gemmata massiliana]VTR94527.1 quinone oxidoreductase : Alcohol dehydrogenase zinc-binding domain protein OS=Anaeromyxobacter sp. (strain Fw109-5) GN=Anae109_2985 PE=4 SV=1: ADH_N: ADH_zinc_N [Gemmata massiliana]
MPKAIRIQQTGGPEVLRWEDVEVGEPGPGQARIRHTAVGVNFIDTYHRSGLYPIPLPSGLGSEGAGIVEAVGPDVTVVKPGDRVAYAGGPPGSYSQVRLIPAHILVPVPEGVTDQTAAAVMLKGMTAQYLIRRTYTVKPGETVLFHAAAGGVGLFACQWLKALGATVIGTVGSDEKAAIARAHGCDHLIISTREDVAKRVREITGGVGVPVVYDSIGKDTFMNSLDCLRPLGLMVSFGNSSGKVTPFDIGVLSQKGSLYLARPTLATYTATRADLEATARDVFEAIRTGKVKVEVRHTYPLDRAEQVHRDLEGRRTVGSIVMTP